MKTNGAIAKQIDKLFFVKIAIIKVFFVQYNPKNVIIIDRMSRTAGWKYTYMYI